MPVETVETGRLYHLPPGDYKYVCEDDLSELPEDVYCEDCKKFVKYRLNQGELICPEAHILLTFKQ